MNPPFTAILDACVLYPFALRDVLIQLATTNLFRARWTAHIHAEWKAAIQRNFPAVSPASLDTLSALMDAAVLDSLVTGYEPLIDRLVLPDPKDRHVLAAAIVADAQLIITHNIRHFPQRVLAPFGVKAQRPDEFTMSLLEADHDVVCGAVRACRARLKRPPFSAAEFLDRLHAQGLVGFARALRLYAAKL